MLKYLECRWMKSSTFTHGVFEIIFSITDADHGHLQVDILNVVELKTGTYLELDWKTAHRKKMILSNGQVSGM